MRVIFYIYCLTYIALALCMYFIDMSMVVSKIFFSLGMLSTGFPLIACMAILVNPYTVKSHRTDSKYLNFCLAAGTFRIIFWSCAPFGLRDHVTILLLNAFSLSIYALLESKFTRISNEYFKY